MLDTKEKKTYGIRQRFPVLTVFCNGREKLLVDRLVRGVGTNVLMERLERETRSKLDYGSTHDLSLCC